MALSEAARKKRAEYQREYKAKHRDKINEYQREYRKAHPDKEKQWRESYWERKAMAGEEI